MPQYAEGQLSKSGKYRMQGGQWVAAGEQAPAAQAQVPPTAQPPMAAVQRAVSGGVEEATGPPVPGLIESMKRGAQQGMAKSIAQQAAAVGRLGPAANDIGQPIADGAPLPYRETEKQVFGAMKGPSPDTGGGKSPWYAPWKIARTAGQLAGYLPIAPAADVPAAMGAGPALAGAGAGAVWGALGEHPATDIPINALGGAGLAKIPAVAQRVKSFMGRQKVNEPAAMTLEQAGAQNAKVTTGDVGADLDAIIEQYTAQKAPPIDPVPTGAPTPINEPAASPGPLFDPLPPRPKSAIPTPMRQPELFPSPVMSPVKYGPGFGPVEPPPTGFNKSFGGNVPPERVGTETSKLKRQMQDIDHIKYLLGVR
jgi:hypothetical protein